MLDADTTVTPPPAEDAVATPTPPPGMSRIDALRELLRQLAGEAIADPSIPATEAVGLRDGFRDLDAMVGSLHDALAGAAEELATGTGELSMATIESLAAALDVAQAPSSFGLPQGGR
jgi:predicted trehalose synthase